MQMEPAQRYQAALEIQRDIDAWRGGSKIRIELPVEPPPVPAKAPISRTTIALSAAAVLVLALGGVYAARKFSSPSGAPAAPVAPLHSLAILPFHNSTSDPKLDWIGSA